MNSKIKILIADPQELFRKSISLLLKQQDDFNVCGDVSNGKELIDKVKIGDYDIVILDIDLHLIDGKTALSIIHSRFQEVRVIVLSSKYEMTLLSDFMANGASAYLSKACDVKTLFHTIRTVHKDGYYFDKSISEAMLFGLKNKTTLMSKEENFTDKEMNIIRKICDGLSNKEIAQSLSISLSTVDFHKGKIYSKTNCCSSSELLKYSIRKGLVSLATL